MPALPGLCASALDTPPFTDKLSHSVKNGPFGAHVPRPDTVVLTMST